MRVDEDVQTVVQPRALIEHTVGSIVRQVFGLFFRNFRVLFLISLPIVPFRYLKLHGEHSGSSPLEMAGLAGSVVTSFLTWMAVTVAVSDACIGNRPSIARAYGRAFGSRSLRILATYALFTAAIGAVPLSAYALARIGTDAAPPGAAIMAGVLVGLPAFALVFGWYMLTLQVVVLEPFWGRHAMRRSRGLGDGYYLRNLTVVAFCMAVVLVLHALPVALAEALVLAGNTAIADIVLSLATPAFAPLYAIAAVLVYYDMRVRKEAYDLDGLTADLNL